MKKSRAFMETCRMIHRVSPSCIPLTLLNGILNAIAPFASLLLSSFLLDALFLEKNEQKALVLAGSLLLLSFIMMVLLAYLEKQTTTMKTRLQYEIEETILKHTLDLRYELLEDPATLDHLQQAREGQNGSGGIEWFLYYMQEFIKSSAVIIQSLVILVMMLKKQSVVGNALIQFAHSAYLPVVFIVLFAVVLLCNIALMKRKNEELTHQFYDNVAGNRRFAYYSQICSSDYQVGKDIRLYHMEGMLSRRIRKEADQLMNLFYHYAKRFGVIGGLEQLVAQSMNLFFAGVVLVRFMAKTITYGELMRYSGAIVQLSSALRTWLSSIMSMQLRARYFQAYATYLHLPAQQAGKKQESLVFTSLELKDVSFCYPHQDQPVLKHVSMRIERGDHLAFVGMNGAGKTTLIKLLLRLYEPSSGVILLNGKPLQSYDLNAYWSLFSSVFQDFQLFPFPIKENIAGGLQVDEEKAWEQLERAGLKKRMRELEKGLATSLSKEESEGVDLSGGEEQKLAIARALYYDRDFIVLDEPTAALDPLSEYEIYHRLEMLAKDKTSIMISHRMSSCRMAKHIYVFDQGEIVESGTHAELLEKMGLYHRLWHAQAHYYEA